MLTKVVFIMLVIIFFPNRAWKVSIESASLEIHEKADPPVKTEVERDNTNIIEFQKLISINYIYE